jgi:tRNA(Ile)-lysidine synthase
LQQEWLVALENLRDDTTNSLDAPGWLALPAALRDPLLAHWLHAQGLTAPTTAQRQQIERQCTAQDGQLPCISWPGVELHVWKNRLWAMTPRSDPNLVEDMLWQGESLRLTDHGLLRLEPAVRLPIPLHVRWRRGGERLKPVGDRHTRELRSLFQAGAIPPWQRDACPLLYEGDELIAVADRWLSARAEAIFQQAGAQPRWQPGR